MSQCGVVIITTSYPHPSPAVYHHFLPHATTLPRCRECHLVYPPILPSRVPTHSSCRELPWYKGGATGPQLVCGLQRVFVHGMSERNAVAFVNARSGKLADDRVLTRCTLHRYILAIPTELRMADEAKQLTWVHTFNSKSARSTVFAVHDCLLWWRRSLLRSACLHTPLTSCRWRTWRCLVRSSGTGETRVTD